MAQSQLIQSQLMSPSLESLPGRDLDPHELQELVTAIARDPDRWAHLVGFDDDERVYASLHRDAHVDVWLLCWTPVNDTGWHDHDISSGAVAVVAGELVENNLRVGSPSLEKRVGAGESFGFGPDHIHRLNGADARHRVRARLQPAAVADGPVRRQRRRRTPTAVGVLRRRAATDRVTPPRFVSGLEGPRCGPTADESVSRVVT